MHLEHLDGPKFKQMFLGGVARLNARKQEINDLNVFPVPDGDTGTNMILTIQAAILELNKDTDNSVNTLAKSISTGSLMGARGNSGVILSQLFRGFAKAVEGKKVIDAEDLASALQEGVNAAYRAVLKPVEGTMLTVAKDAARAAQNAARQNNSIIYVLEKVVEQSLDTLNRTPSMLPVLKQAGVVDAGGKGVYYLYMGFLNVLKDSEILEDYEDLAVEPKKDWEAVDLGSIEFAYCTEFIIKGRDMSVPVLQTRLEPLGDSLLVVGEEDLIKVHIHTNTPGTVLEICTGMGMLHQIKIDNMLDQHQETHWVGSGEVEKVEGHEIGVITVAAGDGLKELLVSMGVDAIIEGGQTMNPSTEDFLLEVDKLPMSKIIILPNNKNIILAAEQAKKLSGKEIEVIPSTTVPQGISAVLCLNKVNTGLEENVNRMKQALSMVKTGQVTSAVRNSKYNGHSISQGDYIGMNNGDLTVVKTSLEEAVTALMEDMMQEEDELVTFYYGLDVLKEEALEIISIMEEKYSDKEFEVYNGGQPLYHFIISIE